MAVLYLRVSEELCDRIGRAAYEDDLSITKWVVAVLHDALEQDVRVVRTVVLRKQDASSPGTCQ